MEGGEPCRSRDERLTPRRDSCNLLSLDLSHTPAGKQFRKRITAREIGNFLILHESAMYVCMRVRRKTRTRNTRSLPTHEIGLRLASKTIDRSVDRVAPSRDTGPFRRSVSNRSRCLCE